MTSDSLREAYGEDAPLSPGQLAGSTGDRDSGAGDSGWSEARGASRATA